MLTSGFECDLGHSVAVTGGSGLLFQDGVRRSRPPAPAHTRLPQSLESRPVAVVFGHGCLAVRVVPDTAEWLIAISHMADTLRLMTFLHARGDALPVLLATPKVCLRDVSLGGHAGGCRRDARRAIAGSSSQGRPCERCATRDVNPSMASPPSVRHTAISHIGGTPLLARLCPGDARVCSVVHISDRRAIHPAQASADAARVADYSGRRGTKPCRLTPPRLPHCTAPIRAARCGCRFILS